MALLEELRKKPDSTKRNIAFASALSIALIVGLIWITTVPARFGEGVPVAEDTATGTPPSAQSAETSVGETFSNIKEQAGAVFESFRSPDAEPVVSDESASQADATSSVEASFSEPQEETKRKVILIGTTTSAE